MADITANTDPNFPADWSPIELDLLAQEGIIL
jgi:hypothetical protein